MKRAQLLDAFLLVLAFLVVVLESGGAPFGLENSRDFIERQLRSLAQLIDEPLDGRVHHASEGKRCQRPFL